MQLHWGRGFHQVVAVVVRLHECQSKVCHFNFPAIQINKFHSSSYQATFSALILNFLMSRKSPRCSIMPSVSSCHSSSAPYTAKAVFTYKSCFFRACACEQLGSSLSSTASNRSLNSSVTFGRMATGKKRSDCGCLISASVDKTSCPVKRLLPKS